MQKPILLTALCLFCLFSISPVWAKKSMFFANKLPDFSQTEIDEEIHGYGAAYCAPTAASNVFRWLHPDRTHQGKLIKLLASSEYMDTDVNRGTIFQNFLKGVSLYMNQNLRGYKSLKYQGIGSVKPEYATGIMIPEIRWIADGLGMKKATWLRLGYYDYDEKKQQYTRKSGHVVNLVGYNLSPRDDVLVVHDPATAPDRTINNDFMVIKRLEEGAINYGKTTIPAQGILSVKNGKDIYPDADVIIIEGAVRLETN